MDFDETFVKSSRGLDKTSLRSFRAQFWSIDLVFAVVIFGFVVTILAYTWFNMSSQLASSYGGATAILRVQGQTLSQQFMSPGSPGNWQSTVNTLSTGTWGNVSIGIGNPIGVGGISSNKLYTFVSMANSNYQATKQPLGVAFDYFIKIASVSGSFSIVAGEDPNTYSGVSVFVQRIPSSLNGVPVIVTVELWAGTAFATG